MSLAEPTRRLLERDADLARLLRHVSEANADDPAHDDSHLLRVARWTATLVADTRWERSAYAAALLHDVVNLPKDHPERRQASKLSASKARTLLVASSFSSVDIDAIAIAIEDHSYSVGAIPRNLLGKALQDADRLDALGAIGIFRLVSTGSRLHSAFFDDEDPWCTSRRPDDRRYMIDHFFTKLLRLPSTMQTDEGRAEAERRVRFMRAFLEQLGSELHSPYRDLALV